MNYLINEEFDTGKGANTVVSMLHHFLEHHTLGEEEVELHADNCVGQNKNNMVIQVGIVTKIAITTKLVYTAYFFFVL